MIVEIGTTSMGVDLMAWATKGVGGERGGGLRVEGDMSYDHERGIQVTPGGEK